MSNDQTSRGESVLATGAAALGPATIDGAELTPRQRAIVAMLVLRRHRPVTTDELVDAVWGEAVPATARQSLQNQITRLRRQFGVDVIETSPAGYTLERSSDVAAFERTADTWLRRPIGIAAVAPLAKSLGLWRGTPFVDLDDLPDIGPERSRLVELRRQVEEHLAVCRLATGDLGRAISGLSVLAEQDPCRERAWGLLIVALHRSGRDAEALNMYRLATKRLLALGLTPSRDLVQMHTALSRGESISSPLLADLDGGSVAQDGRCAHRSMRMNRCGERKVS